jgi:argininosuccinate synthase
MHSAAWNRCWAQGLPRRAEAVHGSVDAHETLLMRIAIFLCATLIADFPIPCPLAAPTSRPAAAKPLPSNMLSAQHRVTRQARAGGNARLAAGIDATQSSVSRDLRDMGVIKLKTGYRRCRRTSAGRTCRPISDSVAGFVRTAQVHGRPQPHGRSRTAVGAAQRVALSRGPQRAGREIAGTLSGDDTIFVATADRARPANSCSRGSPRYSRGKARFSPEYSPRNLQRPGAKPHPARLLRRPRHLVLRALAERRRYGRPVVTRHGQHRQHRRRHRADARGAVEDAGRRVAHHLVDARPAFFEQVIKYLVMGQRPPRPALSAVRRRRARLQAQTVAQCGAQARHRGGRTRLHRRGQRPGALRGGAAHPGARTRDPRTGARPRLQASPSSLPTWSRASLPVPPFGAAYSINRGLWGTTIGGQETLDSRRRASPRTRLGADAPAPSTNAAARRSGTRSASKRGIPGARSTASAIDPVALIERRRGARRAGSASAVASTSATPSSAPRAASPSRRRPPRSCSTAHRELEKLVLSARQARLKDSLAGHLRRPGPRGPAPGPGVRVTSRRCFVSSQQRVTGEVQACCCGRGMPSWRAWPRRTRC